MRIFTLSRTLSTCAVKTILWRIEFQFHIFPKCRDVSAKHYYIHKSSLQPGLISSDVTLLWQIPEVSFSTECYPSDTRIIWPKELKILSDICHLHILHKTEDQYSLKGQFTQRWTSSFMSSLTDHHVVPNRLTFLCEAQKVIYEL